MGGEDGALEPALHLQDLRLVREAVVLGAVEEQRLGAGLSAAGAGTGSALVLLQRRHPADEEASRNGVVFREVVHEWHMLVGGREHMGVSATLARKQCLRESEGAQGTEWQGGGRAIPRG